MISEWREPAWGSFVTLSIGAAFLILQVLHFFELQAFLFCSQFIARCYKKCAYELHCGNLSQPNDSGLGKAYGAVCLVWTVWIFFASLAQIVDRTNIEHFGDHRSYQQKSYFRTRQCNTKKRLNSNELASSLFYDGFFIYELLQPLALPYSPGKLLALLPEF